MPSILPTLSALVSAAVVVTASNPWSGKPVQGLPESITVGVIGDFGWTGWNPAPLAFCNDVMPKLEAANITIPREVQNDCDAGDRSFVNNATAMQEDTATYIGQVSVLTSPLAASYVQEAWVDMYQGPAFNTTRWYQCLGNHDVVKGQSGVTFETQVAPLYDDRWYFGTEGLPYYTYDLQGKDFSATFVVIDSDCFISKYQKSTSVYQNSYTQACYQDRQTQLNFLQQAFSASKAEWKFVQLHHGYMSAASNNTDVAPIISIVEQHNGVVLNGHDHCLAHFYNNNTNFILAGGAGYTQAGDCNNGVAPGPYAKWLGANAQAAANGFVTMDISKNEVVVEYYARDMRFEGGDLYPVKNDLFPSYTFTIAKHAT